MIAPGKPDRHGGDPDRRELLRALRERLGALEPGPDGSAEQPGPLGPPPQPARDRKEDPLLLNLWFTCRMLEGLMETANGDREARPFDRPGFVATAGEEPKIGPPFQDGSAPLLGALAKQPLELRVLTILRLLGGLTAEECADVLERSHKQIRDQIRTSRLLMQRALS